MEKLPIGRMFPRAALYRLRLGHIGTTLHTWKIGNRSAFARCTSSTVTVLKRQKLLYFPSNIGEIEVLVKKELH
jgi:hypothetical protein